MPTGSAAQQLLREKAAQIAPTGVSQAKVTPEQPASSTVTSYGRDKE